eukprot:1911630-Pleurochrysis_carterae.AAC.1
MKLSAKQSDTEMLSDSDAAEASTDGEAALRRERRRAAAATLRELWPQLLYMGRQLPLLVGFLRETLLHPCKGTKVDAPRWRRRLACVLLIIQTASIMISPEA